MPIEIVDKLNALFELSRMKLGIILQSIEGSKDITIEPKLIRPLERICGANWLRSNGIDKIYKLQETDPVHTKKIHVYFISANYKLFKKVLEQIQACLNVDNSLEYHIIIFPTVLNIFEIHLEENGLYDVIKLHSYCWQFLQIDNGILSLELPSSNEKVCANKKSLSFNLSCLFCVVGVPKNTVCLGKNSTNILDQIKIYNAELVPEKTNADFDIFLIMDRSVDYISALLTSPTYTSLLNEVYKISCGTVDKIDKEKVMLFNLDSENDSVYVSIKDKHISEVSVVLGQQAQRLKSETESLKNFDINQMKDYVSTKLKDNKNQSQLLSSHLQACEFIINKLGKKFEQIKSTELNLIYNMNKTESIRTIEDLILDENEYVALRLLCLMTLTQKLTHDEYYNLRLQYLQQFGYDKLYIFHNLITVGLINEPGQTKLLDLIPGINNKKDFHSLANKLKLIPVKPEEINIRTPTCPSYIFGGCYIPILAYLIQLLCTPQPSENTIKQKLDLLGGVLNVENGEKFALQRKHILVCVVGGLTYAEVTALNFVEKLYGCKIVVCTDSMISGNDLMEAVKI